mmetsp:Transcript_12004/g.32937  ORF Transcript_12004/g.32937 Transcript_12004/m.32937 type:complete len:504 (-) Transcript_12004:144-1655(-)
MSRCFVFAILGFAILHSSAGWVQRPLRTAVVQVRTSGVPTRQVARPCAGKLAKEPAPALGKAYSVAGFATMAAWAACVAVAWSKNPMPTPVLNALTVAQPLTPLPLVASVFTSLGRSAAKEGWWAMNRMTYRRLNLGVATASMWLAVVAAFGLPFPLSFKIASHSCAFAITAAHLASALFCLGVWARATRSSPGHHIVRVTRGIVGSIWALVPQTSETGTISKSGSASHLDDPDCPAGRDGRNEYSIACVLFLWFTVMPNLVDLPLATVPAVLGKPLSSAASAWTFLAAVVAYVLKDATQRGRIHSGTTFRYLRYGFIAASGVHLLLVAAELAAIGGGITYLRADIASTVMHAMVVLAALTPPPKVPKQKSGSATAATAPVAVTAAPAVATQAAAPPDAAAPAPPEVAEPQSSPAAALVSAAPVSASAAQPLKLGVDQKVLWNGKSGIVRYMGPTKFAAGEWVGVELDSEAGVHDGTVLGVRYFTCAGGRGIFTQAAQLRPIA